MRQVWSHQRIPSTTVKHRSASKLIDCTSENEEERGGVLTVGLAAEKNAAGVRRPSTQCGAARRAVEGAGCLGFRRRRVSGCGGDAGGNG